MTEHDYVALLKKYLCEVLDREVALAILLQVEENLHLRIKAIDSPSMSIQKLANA